MHAFPVGAQRCGRRCTHFQWVHRAVVVQCGRCQIFMVCAGRCSGAARALSFLSSGLGPLWWCCAGAVIFFQWVRGHWVRCRHFFPVGAGRCGGAARALSFSSSGCGVTVCGAVFFFQWVRAAVVALHGRCHFFPVGSGRCGCAAWALWVFPQRVQAAVVRCAARPAPAFLATLHPNFKRK